MADRYYEVKQRLLQLAECDPDLLAVIAFGSWTRAYALADAYSDLDLLLVCRDPAGWLYGTLPDKLGDVKISFVEPTFAGGMERRILYSGFLDVDLIVLTPEQMDQAVRCGAAAEVMGRGYSVLYDDMEIADRLKDLPAPETGRGMTEQEFMNTVNDFWFHTVWAAKKLLRGELWTAKMCVDAYMKQLLLKMLETARAEREDVWHNGRFLETWAGEDVVTALYGCFAHYDGSDIGVALDNTARVFSGLSRSVAQKQGFPYPDGTEAYARSLLERHTVSDPAALCREETRPTPEGWGS